MATFKNLKDLQAYLQRNIHQVLQDSMELERVMANTMQESVIKVVYEAYKPKEYERRGTDRYGLADTRNMIIENVTFEGNNLRLVFRNIAEGADNLYGQGLADTIENGIKSNWDKQGEWSEPRRFIEDTANRLRENPTEMINAIKIGLAEMGFKVK